MDKEDLEEAKALFDAINRAFQTYQQYKSSKAKRKEIEKYEKEQEDLHRAKWEEELNVLFNKARQEGYKGNFQTFIAEKDVPIYRRKK